MQKRILFIVFSNLRHDARVMRHINFLKENYTLTTVCLDAEPANDYTIIKTPSLKLSLFKKAMAAVLLLLRAHSWAYKILYPYNYVKEALARQSFDLIIANDVETLELSFALAGGKTPVLFDAHEYAPRHFENVLTWRIFFQAFNIHMCKKYIPKLSGMITVGQKIAEEYQKHFGTLPLVITNAPGQQDHFQVNPTQETIKLVHHGIVNASRGIELMIDMMKLLPEHFTLDLILMTPPTASDQTKQYLESLKQSASFTNRIKFVPPVKSVEILPLINHYDLGIIIIPPINFNYANCLPNKFFDSIQARIALAIGPTPEMADMVHQYGIGIVSKEFSAQSLADELMKLSSDDINTFKKNTAIAAAEQNAEQNTIKYLALVKNILSKS